jgi:hypothetical protein
MSTMKQSVAAQEDLVRAVDDLAHIVAQHGPGPVFGDRGYRSNPIRQDWMAAAIRFCRDGDDGLAQRFKPVPSEFIDGDTVKCVCGTVVPVPAREFVECPGGCRWFLQDDSGFWAAQLPQDDS